MRVDGLSLHLLEWGAPGRPALCFLHGGSAHAHWFDRVAPALADRFHVVALDQRGHGLSDWAVPPAYGTEQFAMDLAGVMNGLGWARAAIVGHSMGGHNAMAFAAWHPGRVATLVIADSRPALPEERLRQMRQRGARPLRRHPTLDAAVSSFRLLPRETVADPPLLAHLARVGVVERDGAWVYRFDPACSERRRPVDAWPLLPAIAAPTLLVRGEGSPIMTRDMAERMRAAIPRAFFVDIPGAFHHLT
ncbi:MAG: alpha/beta hydrolase, partial [Candidatus Rokubacteria bacterium]|nr:alpha/beta hydrolase [Candidatus Rokubacteria bacterium]